MPIWSARFFLPEEPFGKATAELFLGFCSLFASQTVVSYGEFHLFPCQPGCNFTKKQLCLKICGPLVGWCLKEISRNLIFVWEIFKVKYWGYEIFQTFEKNRTQWMMHLGCFRWSLASLGWIKRPSKEVQKCYGPWTSVTCKRYNPRI